MPSYDQWNEALLSYFKNTLPAGAALYLYIDTPRLEVIGEQAQWQYARPAAGWCADFCAAVQHMLMRKDKIKQELLLTYTLSLNPNKTPRSLGWLCLQVLAASKMRSDTDKSLGNYYVHLRELLGIPGKGKPSSLNYAHWETLWQRWNQWVSAQGWESTADNKQGKYIGYPLSQCLLREGEAEQCERFWHDKKIKADFNRSQLRQWFSRQALYRINPRLQPPLNSGQPPELFDQLYLRYLDGAWQHPQASPQRQRRSLEAGLYRHENHFEDTVHYWLLPRQRQGLLFSQLNIADPTGQIHPPKEMQAGWYQPIAWDFDGLDQNQELQILDNTQLNRLLFRGSRVWALVADPEQPDSIATWHRPEPGEPFILLCHHSLKAGLQMLRELELLSTPRKNTYTRPFGPPSGWEEYFDCEILSLDNQQWQQIQQPYPELWELLYPRVQLRLSCSGGLRGRSRSGQGGWLSDCPPSIQILRDQAQADTYALSLFRIDAAAEAQLIWQHTTHHTQLTDLPWQGPGQYRLRVESSTGQHEKQIRLLDWPELRLSDTRQDFEYDMREKGVIMRGGVLQHV